ncbi:phage tail assembly protein [Methylomonas sp. EFPC1]|uniref:phage tail assembly protein n=1 Tax=Methylomonas sp. EFPC1 TaxID=2812647 RepID=UPI001966EF33|nr:phage tail assembly protein [Methylomonas sp. EFPC1]QSB03235.1 phage tail assembly protein [Methylomonas sp. EFPC1]
MTGAKVTLQYPLSNGTAVLNVRRPKVRDQLVADKTPGSEADKEIAMFANLCEVTPEEIQELDMADYKKLQAAYSGFLSSASATPAQPA